MDTYLFWSEVRQETFLYMSALAPLVCLILGFLLPQLVLEYTKTSLLIAINLLLFLLCFYFYPSPTQFVFGYILEHVINSFLDYIVIIALIFYLYLGVISLGRRLENNWLEIKDALKNLREDTRLYILSNKGFVAFCLLFFTVTICNAWFYPDIPLIVLHHAFSWIQYLILELFNGLITFMGLVGGLSLGLCIIKYLSEAEAKPHFMANFDEKLAVLPYDVCEFLLEWRWNNIDRLRLLWFRLRYSRNQQVKECLDLLDIALAQQKEVEALIQQPLYSVEISQSAPKNIIVVYMSISLYERCGPFLLTRDFQVRDALYFPISVDVALPMPCQPVFFCTASGDVMDGHLVVNFHPTGGDYELFWRNYDDSGKISNVTYWVAHKPYMSVDEILPGVSWPVYAKTSDDYRNRIFATFYGLTWENRYRYRIDNIVSWTSLPLFNLLPNENKAKNIDWRYIATHSLKISGFILDCTLAIMVFIMLPNALLFFGITDSPLVAFIYVAGFLAVFQILTMVTNS